MKPNTPSLSLHNLNVLSQSDPTPKTKFFGVTRNNSQLYKTNSLYNNPILSKNNTTYVNSTPRDKNVLDNAICAKYLAVIPHYIYCSKDANGLTSTASFIIATIDIDNKICGCIMDKQDTSEFAIEFNSKHNDTKTIKKALNAAKIIPYKIIHVPDNKYLDADLLNFCKKFSFTPEKLSIGIIYIKKNQITLDTIFENEYNNSSDNYKNFLRALNVSDTFDESNLFDDVFNESIKIRWYPSTHMDSDQIRQYIGNCQCVVLYYDDYTFLKEVLLNIFGKVTRIFICVTYNRGNTYSIGVIRKTVESTASIDNYVTYGHDDIYNEILQRANDGTIQLKKKSELSYLYTLPREVALNKIRSQYV